MMILATLNELLATEKWLREIGHRLRWVSALITTSERG